MEANSIHTTLYQFLFESSSIDLTTEMNAQKLILHAGDMLQIHYLDNISKQFAIKKIIQNAAKKDILSLVIDMTGVHNASNNCWVYKAFSAVDFLYHVNTLPSLLRDIKKRTLIVIDAFNTYLTRARPEDFFEPDKTKLTSQMTYNIFSILDSIRQDYKAIILFFWQFNNASDRRYLLHDSNSLPCYYDYTPDSIIRHIWLSTHIIQQTQLLQLFYLETPEPIFYVYNQEGDLIDARPPELEIP